MCKTHAHNTHTHTLALMQACMHIARITRRVCVDESLIIRVSRAESISRLPDVCFVTFARG